jgi:hypothetical protein
MLHERPASAGRFDFETFLCDVQLVTCDVSFAP